MTRDIVVVTGTHQSTFAKEVLDAVRELESYDYTVEVKYSTTEGKYDGSVVFSAMLHAYDAE